MIFWLQKGKNEDSDPLHLPYEKRRAEWAKFPLSVMAEVSHDFETRLRATPEASTVKGQGTNGHEADENMVMAIEAAAKGDKLMQYILRVH